MHDGDLDNEAAKPEDGSDFPLCPYLALRTDPETRALYPRMDHVCRLPRVYPPSLQWQQRYCTSRHFGLCPHFRVHGKEAPVALPPPIRRSPITLRRAVTAAGVLVLIGTGAMLAVANSAADGGAHTPATGAQQTRVPTTITVPVNTTASPVSVAPATAQPTATPATPATEAPTPAPEPTTAPTAPATEAPAAQPTPAPTSAPTPTVSNPATYVVAEGDTLASIASRYNVSVDALIALNDISDPNVIHVGTVLRLPSAP